MLLVGSLTPAIVLAAFFPGVWWEKLLLMLISVWLLFMVFGTAYFAGKSYVYRHVAHDMKEINEMLDAVQKVRAARQTQVPPPNRYH